MRDAPMRTSGSCCNIHLCPDAALDFWFDFASTYSYPAAPRIRSFARQAGVLIRFRPFLLGLIFKAQGWQTFPFNLYEAKGRNIWRDLERICSDLSPPFWRPEPFPQNSLLGARVALIGLAEAWGEDFCEALYRARAVAALTTPRPSPMHLLV